MKIASCIVYIAGCVCITMLIKDRSFNELSFLTGLVMYASVHTVLDGVYKKYIR